MSPIDRNRSKYTKKLAFQCIQNPILVFLSLLIDVKLQQKDISQSFHKLKAIKMNMRTFHKFNLKSINAEKTDSSYQNTMIQLMAQLIRSQHQMIHHLKGKGNEDQDKSENFGEQSELNKSINNAKTSPYRVRLPNIQKMQVKKSIQLPSTQNHIRTPLNKQLSLEQSIKQLNKKVAIIPSLQECIKKQTSVNELIFKELKKMNQRQQVTSPRKKQYIENDKMNNQLQNEEINSLDYRRFQGFTENGKVKQQKFYSRITDINNYSDKREIKVKIDFTDMFGLPSKGSVNIQQHQIDKFIVEWLGVVYRATASIAWNNLKIHSLNFQEAKILFTENIIYNFIELNKELRNLNIRKQAYTAKLVNSTSTQILDYLCKQYPQTKIEDPNIALREAIPQIDEKGKLVYEQTSNCKPAFQYKQNRDYSREIMCFINFLIDTTNKQYGPFEKFMVNLFQKIYVPVEKRGQEYNIKQLDQQGQAYRQNAKKHTKYVINRKISKNTPKFNNQQIESGVFSSKSSTILRILTKWTQQLLCVVDDPKFYVRNWFFMFKSHSGKEIDVSFEVKIAICKQILAKRSILYETLQKIKQECFDMQGDLSQIKYITDPNNVHVLEQHINVGLFSINMKQALSIYMYKQLNEIIHFLLEIPKKIDETQIGLDQSYFIEQARKYLDNINLVTCRIMDLLRCKIISSEVDIIWLIKKFEELHEDPNSGFELVRVKDRLNQGTRDILVNARVGVLDGSYLVNQIQVSVANKTDQQQDLLDKYNHFLYELKRSQFGPIIENVSIWTNLEQRTSYFKKIYKFKIENAKIQKWTHQCGFGYFQQITMPIICKNCDLFYAVPQVCFSHVKCSNCCHSFCGKCYFNCLSAQQKQVAIFRSVLEPRIFEKLELFEDYSKPLPRVGFIIKKNNLKIDVQFFRTMQCITPQQNEISIVSTGIASGRITFKKYLDLTILNKQNNKYTLSEQSRQLLKDYIIFEITGSPIEKLPLNTIIQKFKSEFSEYRFISFLEQTNYIKSLLPISKKKQKKKLLAEVNKSVKNNQSVAFMKLGQLIIFVQVVIPEQNIRDALIQDGNIYKLKKFAKQKSSVIWLENKKVSVEFIQIKSKISSYLYQRWERKLKKLYLNGNQIQSIEFLETFKALEVIQIKKNKLKSLKGLENSTQLKQLKFSFNSITSLKPLKQCINLEEIQANNNQILECDGIQDLANLKSFEFHSNKIQKFEKFENLQKLDGMFFRGNPISSLTGIVCIKNCLTQIIISKVKMTTIPKQMAQFQQLESLYFNENYLVKIENINTLKNLKKLSLRRNEIETMEGLEGLTLESLKLSTNKIKKIQGIDSSLQTLQELALRQNPLQDCTYLKGVEIDFQISYSPQMISQNAKRDLSKIIGAGHTSSGGSDSFA